MSRAQVQERGEHTVFTVLGPAIHADLDPAQRRGLLRRGRTILRRRAQADVQGRPGRHVHAGALEDPAHRAAHPAGRLHHRLRRHGQHLRRGPERIHHPLRPPAQAVHRSDPEQIRDGREERPDAREDRSHAGSRGVVDDDQLHARPAVRVAAIALLRVEGQGRAVLLHEEAARNRPRPADGVRGRERRSRGQGRVGDLVRCRRARGTDQELEVARPRRAGGLVRRVHRSRQARSCRTPSAARSRSPRRSRRWRTS